MRTAFGSVPCLKLSVDGYKPPFPHQTNPMIIPARNQWYGWTGLALIQALLIWTDTPPALTWGGLLASALFLWQEKPAFTVSCDYGAAPGMRLYEYRHKRYMPFEFTYTSSAQVYVNRM